jgi:hypothetical protein
LLENCTAGSARGGAGKPAPLPRRQIKEPNKMNTENESSFRKYIESIPSLLGITSAMALIASVIYDWGYLKYLGVTFSEVPTTLSDHLRSTILWAPWGGLLVLAGLGIEAITRYLEERLERTPSNPSNKLDSVFQKVPYYVFLLFTIGVFLLAILGAKIPLAVWQLSLTIFWLVLSSSNYVQRKLLGSFPIIFRSSIKFVPAVIIFLGFYGAITAEADQESNSKCYRIYLNSETQNYIEAKHVRNFEKAILVTRRDMKIYEIISLDHINRIEIIPEVDSKTVESKSSKQDSTSSDSTNSSN